MGSPRKARFTQPQMVVCLGRGGVSTQRTARDLLGPLLPPGTLFADFKLGMTWISSFFSFNSNLTQRPISQDVVQRPSDPSKPSFQLPPAHVEVAVHPTLPGAEIPVPPREVLEEITGKELERVGAVKGDLNWAQVEEWAGWCGHWLAWPGLGKL